MCRGPTAAAKRLGGSRGSGSETNLSYPVTMILVYKTIEEDRRLVETAVPWVRAK